MTHSALSIRDSLPKFSYEGLLFCLVFLFALIPISEEVVFTQVIIKSGFTLVLLASVYLVSNRPILAIFAIILAMPALVGHWLELFDNLEIPRLVQLGFSMALQIYVTIIMLLNLFRAKTISRSTLYGAVCIYIMIGLIYSSCYSFIATLDSGSFSGFDRVTLRGSTDVGGFSHHLFYYSFITLTTLGYGNIAPKTVLASALSSSEALIGQFYMTILVARLVALYVSSNQDTFTKKEEERIERELDKSKKT